MCYVGASSKLDFVKKMCSIDGHSLFNLLKDKTIRTNAWQVANVILNQIAVHVSISLHIYI